MTRLEQRLQAVEVAVGNLGKPSLREVLAGAMTQAITRQPGEHAPELAIKGPWAERYQAARTRARAMRENLEDGG